MTVMCRSKRRVTAYFFVELFLGCCLFHENPVATGRAFPSAGPRQLLKDLPPAEKQWMSTSHSPPLLQASNPGTTTPETFPHLPLLSARSIQQAMYSPNLTISLGNIGQHVSPRVGRRGRLNITIVKKIRTYFPQQASNPALSIRQCAQLPLQCKAPEAHHSRYFVQSASLIYICV